MTYKVFSGTVKITQPTIHSTVVHIQRVNINRINYQTFASCVLMMSPFLYNVPQPRG